MKRLLCIVGCMNMGGAETFLMKIHRTIDRTKYQMDYAVAEEQEGVYDKEIISLGGKIYHITPKSKGIFRNFKDIRDLVNKKKYTYVLRVSQHSLSALELLAAKLGGAKVLAFRSSNSNACESTLNGILHNICMFMPRFFANVYIAPSTEAGKFMFGKASVKEGKVNILHNAVNYEMYAYAQTKRKRIRRELDLGNSLVVGHVGRFNHQKNHIFLLEVFKELSKIQESAKLILVGKGEKEQELRSKVVEMGIKDKVIFVAPRSDVNEFYSAFDVLVFPSKFEGMPNVLIEAQAASLPCVASDTITKEAKITPYVSWLSLNETAVVWAKKALDVCHMERSSTYKKFVESKYEVKDSSQTFCKLIFDKE